MRSAGAWSVLVAAALTAGLMGTVTGTASATSSITKVEQTPYIIDDAGVHKSETKLTISNTDPAYSGWVRISVPGRTPYLEPVGTVGTGSSAKTVHVAELVADGDRVTFQVFDNAGAAGTARAATTLAQKKIRHWTVYVAHDWHTDVGYTATQEQLRNAQWPAQTDAAFQYIADTNGWPAAERFKYHMESSFLLDGSYLDNRNADRIEALKAQLAAGRLAYSTTYLNQSYEAMSTEELVRFYYLSQRNLKDKLGVSSSGVAMIHDNPSFSWSQVDLLADIGVKYVHWGYNLNPRTPKIPSQVYPLMFHLKGRNPASKVLVFNGPLYNVDEMQFVPDGSAGTTPENVTAVPPPPLSATVQAVSTTLMNKFQTASYVGDAALENVAQYWDNGPLYPQVHNRIREMNARTDAQGRRYLYPRFVNSTMRDFYDYVDTNFGASIPTYQGTYENWWNYGIPADAHSEGVQRAVHDRTPVAELFATLANQAGTNVRYPYGNIRNAYIGQGLYDEHTFGAMDASVGDIHFWKRNAALAARNQSERVLNDSLSTLDRLIPTTGPTVVAHNPLSWNRSDVVTVPLAGLPAHFDITDVASGAAVRYQKLDDGTVRFVAPDVPGLGYKTFRITPRADDPVFPSTITKTANTLENSFYRVTFGGQGEVTSIVDKRHGNAEMVDAGSPHKLNEFLYLTSDRDAFRVRSESKVTDASVTIGTGAVQGAMTSHGFARGTAGITRSVILYDSVPRIDIVNSVKKTDSPGFNSVDEEGFFTFPLNVPNFTLRHEMPTGDVRPHVTADINDPASEQLYTSSTDFYTVNRWIDASNPTGNYGITLFPTSAPVVHYGGRRSLLYDVDYNTPKPWVYSNVYSNKWTTNFIDTQPGPTTFSYSLRSHGGPDWRAGRADQHGWETTVPLEARVIGGAQSGGGYHPARGQWIGIDRDNVVLTAAKLAEANGEGTILRFNETTGRDTRVSVNLSYFNPSSVTETDLVENDRGPLAVNGGTVSFTIPAYGWKTIRLRYGAAPAPVTGVSATRDAAGTRVAWTDLADPKLAGYEVFRGTRADFTAGTGSYVGTTTANSFYDKQVVNGVTGTYFYKVRAARGGLKGAPSAAVAPAGGSTSDSPAPSAPANLRVDYAFGNRVSLSWEPATDNLKVKGYRVFRDGTQIADHAEIMNSHLDITVVAGATHNYLVRAYDQAGNLSAASNTVTARVARGDAVPGNIAPHATPSASSQFSARFAAAAVTDRLVGDTGEWASAGEANPWVQLTWPGTVTLNRIVLYDRADDANDNANGGTLTFSDGSSIPVSGIPKDGAAKPVFFPAKNVTWARFQVAGGVGPNVGLSEIEAFVPESANLAGTATATSSSQFSTALAAGKAVDDVIGVHDSGEWASAGQANPWIQLTWPAPRTIGKVVLHDRVNLADNANGGTLSFSDGSTISVTGIPPDGSPLAVTFPPRPVSWVRFQVAGGTGSNVGLSEFQAVQPDLARGRAVTASSGHGAEYRPANGVDGDYATRWASANGGAPTQTYQVDLGAAAPVAAVGINWEYAYASEYTIAVSTDGAAYTTVVTRSGNTTMSTRDTFAAHPARYVRLTMTGGPHTIYSFWELAVHAAP